MVQKVKRMGLPMAAKALVLVLAAAALSQAHAAAAPSSVNTTSSPEAASTSIPVGGMAVHKLDSKQATAAALPSASAQMLKADHKSDASIVVSMLSANGSQNPDLVSQAVSDALATASSSATGAKATKSAEGKGREQKAASAATQTWHWDAGSFGCPDGKSGSGTAYVCRATGTPAAKAAERRQYNAEPEPAVLLFAKRQDDNKSGNGGPPEDVINKDSPDVPWLDLVVGGVPYKNGDLAPSIVWILATLFLIPFFLIRLLRRSSLVAHVLFTVFLWGTVMVVTFGIRAYLANTGIRTDLLTAQNIMLQVLPCLLLEPLLNLLALYSQQGGFPTGVPRVALLLRFLNLVALIIYIVAGVYLGLWMKDWDDKLQNPRFIDERDNFPDSIPISFVRIGPIIAAFFQVVDIIGALLLIPIARGENGSMRPGGFLAFLVILVTLPIVYRVLQTLHAQAELTGDGNDSPFSVFAKQSASTMSAAAMNAVMSLVPVYEVAPTGMYNPSVHGIDWDQLQQTLASRANLQSPIVFNLVYIFPMWLQTFLFFFVHAPGHEGENKLAPASQQP